MEVGVVVRGAIYLGTIVLEPRFGVKVVKKNYQWKDFKMANQDFQKNKCQLGND